MTSSIHISFADDTSVTISGKHVNDYCILSNKVLSQMSKWFSANKLSLNLEETNVIKFITKNSPQYPLNIQKRKRIQNFLAYTLMIIS
jgi:hypothetical protein